MSYVLLVTGMHRSGTSLVASLCERAGLPLGTELLAPRADNPFGFFEDVDFFQFHEDALHARGQNILVTRDWNFVPTGAEIERAQALVAARANHTLWGWKDPRTSLFLDFWNAQLPDARYLFVYRHPFDVVLSLARRGEVVGFDFSAGLEAWYAYNARLVEFAAQHRERVLICNSYTLVNEIDRFKTALAEHLGLELELNPELRDAVFHQGQLRSARRTAASDSLMRQIHPEAMALYDALQAQAVLPESTTREAASNALEQLACYAKALPAPLDAAQRHALLTMLVAVTDGALYEQFTREHVAQTNALETQRRAWEQTAQARAAALDAETAWALPRLRYLETLEANRIVRALVRLGILPRP